MKALSARFSSLSRRCAVALALMLTAAVLPAVALPGSAAAHQRGAAAATGAPATQRVTVRPVTETGQLAAGWHAKTENFGKVFNGTCTSESEFATAAAVDACGFGATSTPICWAATDRSILCTDSLISHTLIRIDYRGTYAQESAPAKPIPLQLKLANGEVCVFHTDGAWAPVSQHPSWVGDYACGTTTAGGYIYAPESVRAGIDTAHPAWTVSFFSTNQAKAVTMDVTAAYYGGIAG